MVFSPKEEDYSNTGTTRKKLEDVLQGILSQWHEYQCCVTHLEGSGGQQLNGGVCIAKGNRELCFNGHGAFTF